MIGLFEILEVKGQQVIAKSKMQEDFKGTFYVPPLYRSECSNLGVHDVFFGILDDVSGLGAILYKIDDGITSNNALNLSHDLNVTGSISGAKLDVSGSISGASLSVTGNISGNVPMASITLTGAHCAAITAGASGGTELTGVQIILQ